MRYYKVKNPIEEFQGKSILVRDYISRLTIQLNQDHLDGQLDLIRVLEVEALPRGKKLELLAATGWDMEFADIAARIKADDAAALDLPECIREAAMLYVHVCV